MGDLYEKQGVVGGGGSKVRRITEDAASNSRSSIATTLGNMGGLYEKQGRLEKAEAKYEESLKMLRTIHGDDANHPSIATTLGNMGGLYDKQGRLEEAEAKYEESLTTTSSVRLQRTLFVYSLAAVAVLSPVAGSGGPTLRLSFHGGSHYNVIISTRIEAKCAKKRPAAAALRPLSSLDSGTIMSKW